MSDVWSVQKIIEEIDKEELVIYIGNDVEMEEKIAKRIVLFTNELKRSGAPSVLFDMSSVLLEMGYSVFLISEEEGELLEDFVENGINVILYPTMTNDPKWLVKVAEIFQEVLVNTMVMMHVVDFMAKYATKVYWWIHEAEIAIANRTSQFNSYSIRKNANVEIWAASLLIQENIRDYWMCESKLLNFYIKDVPAKNLYNRKKLNIINVGDINGNKGQEILVSAFEKLEPEVRNRCELYFCGYNQRYNEEIILKVLDYIDKRNNVHLLGGKTKEELYEIYDEIDIVVVASYYESTSAVAVEGMMKSKLCICTETCGVCKYLKDGESVLTFKRGEPVSLANALTKAIVNYDELEHIRKNGRLVYEKNYTKKVFANRLEELLKK